MSIGDWLTLFGFALGYALGPAIIYGIGELWDRLFPLKLKPGTAPPTFKAFVKERYR